jgi:hypothetical protein
MLPSFLTQQLIIAANPVISNVLKNGGAHGGIPKGEVSAVRRMTLDGFDEIAVAWSPILRTHGYVINLRAVFCHSCPQVTFAPVPHPNYPGGTAPRRCELADLLIVMDHVVGRLKEGMEVVDRRAVLVQAKILKKNLFVLKNKEWVQHELLSWLPAFTFVDARYDARIRNLNQTPIVGLPKQTTEYGGIDLISSPPEWRHELTQTTAPWFNAPISLAKYLAFMATGDSSCSRKAVRGGSDDWSFTVDELLRVTAALPITIKSGVARGNNNIVGFLAAPNGGGIDYIDGDISEWPEGPISTIHLTFGSIDD